MYNSRRTLNIKIEAILVGMILIGLVMMFYKPLMNFVLDKSLNEMDSKINQILSPIE